MKTVFHRLSRDLENNLFKIIGSFIGSNFPGDNTKFRLSLTSTKRRKLGRIFIVKSKHGVVVGRKWLTEWAVMYNFAKQNYLKLFQSGLAQADPELKIYIEQYIIKLKEQVINDYLLPTFETKEERANDRLFLNPPN